MPLAHVERCLAGFPAGQPFPAKALAPAFAGKSVNNAGFLAAVLRAEGLLAPVPGSSHLLLAGPGWPEWKDAMLALPGEPYVPEPPKPKPGTKATPAADDGGGGNDADVEVDVEEAAPAKTARVARNKGGRHAPVPQP